MTIRLECPVAEPRPDTGPARNPTRPSPKPATDHPARIDLRIETEPEGARVFVAGELLGTTPLGRTFPAGRAVELKIQKEGFRPETFEVIPGRVDGGVVRRRLEPTQKGCLDFFAVHPQYNEIAIDGEWLPGRRQRLKGYELPAGTHRVRVRNPNAGKDETFEVEIKPGSPCTSKTVWDPDDG